MLYANNEIWLRKSCRFEILERSTEREGAAWICEMNPSQMPPAQICKFSHDLIVFCLSGRGIVASEGRIAVLGAMNHRRIRANEVFICRNELRNVFRCLFVLTGNSGCESLIDVFSVSDSEDEWQRQAAEMGCELYLPDPEAEPSHMIQAADHRILVPRCSSFAL